jgi:DNA-binding beta-propeller fold protein YncE
VAPTCLSDRRGSSVIQLSDSVLCGRLVGVSLLLLGSVLLSAQGFLVTRTAAGQTEAPSGPPTAGQQPVVVTRVRLPAGAGQPVSMALDPTGSWLYVASQKKLLRYELRGGVPADPLDVPLPPGVDIPLSLAVNPAGTWLYLTTTDAATWERFPWEGGGFVTVYDLRGGVPSNGINVRLAQPTSWIPLFLAVDPTGMWLYVLNHGILEPFTPHHRYSNVMAFDIRSGVPTRGFDLRPSRLVHHPAGFAVNSLGTQLYVRAEGCISTYQIDAGAARDQGVLPIQSGSEVTVHPAVTHVYHASYPTSIGVSEIRGTVLEMARYIALPEEVYDPGAMTVNPSGTRLYVATRQNPNSRSRATGTSPAYLTVYDISAGEPSLWSNLPLPSPITRVASMLANASGSQLYLAASGQSDEDAGSLLVLDLREDASSGNGTQ